MPQGGDRARPQGARRPRRPGSRGVREDRRAGQGRAAGLTSELQAEVFHRFAAEFEGAGSPLYASLARACATEPLLAGVVPDLRWDLPLRLFSGVHFLALKGELPEFPRDGVALRGVLATRGEALAAWVAEQPVQTNETQRPWGYRFRYRAGAWGPGGSPLQLSGRELASVPAQLLATGVEIRARIGIDRRPIDVTSPEGALLLESFVWADSPERIERLRRAVSIAAADPPALVEGDYVDVLPSLLAERGDQALTVVYQTASLPSHGSWLEWAA